MPKSKFDCFSPGMVVYDAHMYTMGNTCMRTLGVWSVQIKEVDREKRTILASWNGNTAKTMHEREWKKLRLKPPMIIEGRFTRRLATKQEIADGLAKEAK